jgi:hypothetical protein
MRHWFQEGLHGTNGIETYRAYGLLLQCCDRCLWHTLASAREQGEARNAFLDILTRDAVANAIKKNKEDGGKMLLGRPVQEHAAAPWITL